jgi:hypothetical protein
VLLLVPLELPRPELPLGLPVQRELGQYQPAEPVLQGLPQVQLVQQVHLTLLQKG